MVIPTPTVFSHPANLTHPPNTFLVVDIQGDEKTKKSTSMSAIFCDLRQGKVLNKTIDFIKLNDKDTSAEAKTAIRTEFLKFNWMFLHTDVLISHGVRFDRKMTLAIDEFEHWGSKPWICTMEDFQWPGLESLKQAKVDKILGTRAKQSRKRKRAQVENKDCPDEKEPVKGWLKLKEICEDENYNIAFKAKEGERQLNNAELLTSCLLRVPDLPIVLARTPIFED